MTNVQGQKPTNQPNNNKQTKKKQGKIATTFRKLKADRQVVSEQEKLNPKLSTGQVKK